MGVEMEVLGPFGSVVVRSKSLVVVLFSCQVDLFHLVHHNIYAYCLYLSLVHIFVVASFEEWRTMFVGCFGRSSSGLGGVGTLSQLCWKCPVTGASTIFRYGASEFFPIYWRTFCGNRLAVASLRLRVSARTPTAVWSSPGKRSLAWRFFSPRLDTRAFFTSGLVHKNLQDAIAKAQEDGAELKPIPLPYEMELVEMRIKDKKFIKVMQGKEPSEVIFLCW